MWGPEFNPPVLPKKTVSWDFNLLHANILFFSPPRLGFVQGFVLAKQALYSWVTHPVHFALVILETGGGGVLMNYLPWLTLNCNPPHLSLPRNTIFAVPTFPVSTNFRLECFQFGALYLNSEWVTPEKDASDLYRMTYTSLTYPVAGCCLICGRGWIPNAWPWHLPQR
jgi:hypothetical protein